MRYNPISVLRDWLGDDDDGPNAVPIRRCTECGDLRLVTDMHVDADLVQPGFHCKGCCWLPGVE